MNKGSGSLTRLLLVAFIVLKLLGVIDWSWWWVLSPLWISLLMYLILAGVWLISESRKSSEQKMKEIYYKFKGENR